MMSSKIYTAGLSIFLLTLSLSASESELKSAISLFENELSEISSESRKSELHYQLANAFYHDQEVDKAFQHFLLALKSVENKPQPQMSAEEKMLYEAALGVYLKGTGNDPARVAKQMLDNYEESAEAHPEWMHLNFLMATAYANLGRYDIFFDRFYQGFPYLGETFLAYKTRGILYLRLAQHAISPEERYTYHEEAMRQLTSALERNKNDSGLYKLLIFLAKDEKTDALVLSYLQKMVEHKVHISRGDIYLYVREAVVLGDPSLGQEIIDLARSQYEFSRALSAAQEYLNQCRG